MSLVSVVGHGGSLCWLAAARQVSCRRGSGASTVFSIKRPTMSESSTKTRWLIFQMGADGLRPPAAGGHPGEGLYHHGHRPGKARLSPRGVAALGKGPGW